MAAQTGPAELPKNGENTAFLGKNLKKKGNKRRGGGSQSARDEHLAILKMKFNLKSLRWERRGVSEEVYDLDEGEAFCLSSC